MILSTHIIVAATATKLIGLQDPVAVFSVTLASHYLMDAIPHWDYKLHSVQREQKGSTFEVVGINWKTVWKDFLRVIFDIAIGAVMVWIVFRPDFSFSSLLIPFLIVVGAILPDMLQPAYWFYKKPPMTYIQGFHNWMHAQQKLPFSFLGVGSQVVLQIVLLFILLY